MNDETKGKLVDASVVIAKSLGYITYGAMVAGITGTHGGIIPRPINMWRNQRARRAYREAVNNSYNKS